MKDDLSWKTPPLTSKSRAIAGPDPRQNSNSLQILPKVPSHTSGLQVQDIQRVFSKVEIKTGIRHSLRKRKKAFFGCFLDPSLFFLPYPPSRSSLGRERVGLEPQHLGTHETYLHLNPRGRVYKDASVSFCSTPQQFCQLNMK